MANRVSDKIRLASIDELLCVPGIEGTVDIELGLINEFKNHPFKVVDDNRMDELVDSIKEQGVLSPVLVRPSDNGKYEMISGHRRLHASKIAGINKIPAIVKQLNDDEATIAMVNANLQREEILPSERGYSLKMKMDAMRHQGTCRHDVDKLNVSDRKTAAIVGEGSGLAARSVQRYIRLTYLIPEILDMVDNKRLSLVMGVDISYFDSDIQSWIYQYIKANGVIRVEQIAALKEQKNLDNLTQYTVTAIMNDAFPKKNISKRVSISEKRLNKFFPEDYSASKRERIILELLEKWKNEQEDVDAI